MKDYDVVIIGAGPVGLLLANLLGASGMQLAVFEKRSSFPEESMAIGITPPSLAILSKIGIDQRCIERGVQIRRVYVQGDGRPLGSVDFAAIKSDYPYILSLPQCETITVLSQNLTGLETVTVQMATSYRSCTERDTELEIQLHDDAADETFGVRCRNLVGCDGANSAVREDFGLGAPPNFYRPTFLMADFDDSTDFGADAHLFFTKSGAVESFPLPNSRRRWIIQTAEFVGAPEAGFLESVVLERTGNDLKNVRKYFESPFRVGRTVAKQYYRESVFLCGDAAHLMSPIGGQGMNTGFADAEILATLLEGRMDCNSESIGSGSERYDTVRRRAFTVAANRAACGMWLGTRTGSLQSWPRNLLLRTLLRNRFRDWVAGQFAMV